MVKSSYVVIENYNNTCYFQENFTYINPITKKIDIAPNTACNNTIKSNACKG
jgi:hypothetical protein